MKPLAASGSSIRSETIWFTTSSETRPPESMIALAFSPDIRTGHWQRRRAAYRQWRVAGCRVSRPVWRLESPCRLPALGPSSISFIVPFFLHEVFDFLDQALILVGDQMALRLRNGVERDADHDQERSAAQIEGHASRRDQELGE